MLRLFGILLFLCTCKTSFAQSIKIYGETGFNQWSLVSNGDHYPFDHAATDFGTIPAGESVTHRFRIENTSSDLILLSNVRSDDSAFFAQIPVPAQELDPGETADFNIIYSARAGEARARMTIGYLLDRQYGDYEFSLVGEGERPVFYVDATATGNNDGSSWENAFVELQSALAVIRNNTEPTIRMAEGVYYPDCGAGQIAGDRDSTFLFRYRVALRGSYASGGGSVSREDHPTILSGDLDRNDSNADGNHISESAAHTIGANSYSVATIGGDAILRDVVITGGLADGDAESSQASGAGIFCDHFGAELFVRDCRITGCSSKRLTAEAPPASGAAIYLAGRSDLTLSDSLISNNTVSDPYATEVDGAIISVADGDWVWIEDSEFSDNEVIAGLVEVPGAIQLLSLHNTRSTGNCIVSGVNFIGLRSPLAQLVEIGGFYEAELSRCLVTDNVCDLVATFDSCTKSRAESSAIYGNVMPSHFALGGEVDFTAINLTVSGNQSDSLCRVVPGGGSGTIAIVNSVIDTSIDPVLAPMGADFNIIRTNSLIPGFVADADGNLDGETPPQFEAPAPSDLAPTSAGDYRLREGSPLVEAGAQESGLNNTDVAGLPRRLDWDYDGVLCPDIGAYELTRTARIIELLRDPTNGEVTINAQTVGDGLYVVEYHRSFGSERWIQVARGVLRPGLHSVTIPAWQYGGRSEVFFRLRTP